MTHFVSLHSALESSMVRATAAYNALAAAVEERTADLVGKPAASSQPRTKSKRRAGRKTTVKALATDVNGTHEVSIGGRLS